MGSVNDALVDEYNLVNWSSTFNHSSGKYYLRVFGKNLTDERYRTGNLAVAALWTMASYAPPRWFGGEVGFRFDF